jgi:hypothetical protein
LGLAIWISPEVRDQTDTQQEYYSSTPAEILFQLYPLYAASPVVNIGNRRDSLDPVALFQPYEAAWMLEFRLAFDLRYMGRHPTTLCSQRSPNVLAHRLVRLAPRQDQERRSDRNGEAKPYGDDDEVSGHEALAGSSS